MAGRVHDGYVFAKDGDPLKVSLRTPASRAEREELEFERLSAGATFAIGSGRRRVEEEPDPVRTCFERDRDRILHRSTAFRRLAGKTQVFVFPDDHMRTRLTHALEVTQVARAIAEQLRLNVALTEAIALGHDCGHGPFGHASEDAFSKFLEEGFDHAVWGESVVLAPLNLCEETRDGIRNHSWSRPSPSTAEGLVVSWADRIAYVCHDFEDARSAGIVEYQMLPEEVVDVVGMRRSTQLDRFITDLVNTTVSSGHIAMSKDCGEALSRFRDFNYRYIYARPASKDQATAVRPLLAALVEFYADRPNALPPRTSIDTAELEPIVAGSPASYRRSVEFVAGMTDRFAIRMATSHLGWHSDRLPLGIDTAAR